jgi:hypothetical protein
LQCAIGIAFGDADAFADGNARGVEFNNWGHAHHVLIESWKIRIRRIQLPVAKK